MQATARQTRRNTQALGLHLDDSQFTGSSHTAAGSSSSASAAATTVNPSSVSALPVLDPWKDDRLRDFIAINVQTRVRSFHYARHLPLADVGAQNANRAVQLLMLPRTEASCPGHAADCPLRRNFVRIFGTNLLRHETHASASTVLARAATELRLSTDAASDPVALHSTAHLRTPLRSGPGSSTMAAAHQASPAPVPQFCLTTEASDGETCPSAAADTAACGSSNEVAVDLAAPDASPAPQQQNNSSTSLATSASVALTFGSATPKDFASDQEYACCDECVEAICSHFQGLLNRGVIVDRFSQRDLLFAHWVLFRNMDGAALDAHTSAGRKEALSITIKNGYYNLLKVPKAQVPAAAPPVLPPQLVTSVATASDPVGAPSDKKGAEGKTVVSSRDGPKKRRRDEDEEPDPVAPQIDDEASDPAPEASATVAAARKRKEALRQDVETKTYATRRSAITANHSQQPSPPPEPSPAAAIEEPPVAHRKRRQQQAPEAAEASATAAAAAVELRPTVVAVKRETTSIVAETVPQPQPPPPPPAAATTTKPVVQTRSSRAQLAAEKERIKAIAFLVGDEEEGTKVAARMHACAHPQKSRFDVSKAYPPSFLNSADKSAISEALLPIFDSKNRAGQYRHYPHIPMATPTAGNTEPTLKPFTFAQQCLLFVAASRLMEPNVCVGPEFPKKNTTLSPTSPLSGNSVQNVKLDYWASPEGEVVPL